MATMFGSRLQDADHPGIQTITGACRPTRIDVPVHAICDVPAGRDRVRATSAATLPDAPIARQRRYRSRLRLLLQVPGDGAGEVADGWRLANLDANPRGAGSADG